MLSYVLFDQLSEMSRIGDNFLVRVVTPHPFYRVEAKPVLFQLPVPNHQPQNDGHSGSAGDACRTRSCARQVTEKIHKYTLAGEHVLINQNTHRLTRSEE